jgi:DNA invertase Pin-like site-specific DNA recombinase
MDVGYARVSTREQDLELQRNARGEPDDVIQVSGEDADG